MSPESTQPSRKCNILGGAQHSLSTWRCLEESEKRLRDPLYVLSTTLKSDSVMLCSNQALKHRLITILVDSGPFAIRIYLSNEQYELINLNYIPRSNGFNTDGLK